RQPFEESRRVDDHASGSLHPRLDDEPRDLTRLASKKLLRRAEAGLCTVALPVPSIRMGGGDVLDVEEEGPKELVEEVDSANGNGAERIAVIRVLQRDKLSLSRATRLLPELIRDLQGDFHRSGAGVRVEDAGKLGRRNARELGGQLYRRHRA